MSTPVPIEARFQRRDRLLKFDHTVQATDGPRAARHGRVPLRFQYAVAHITHAVDEQGQDWFEVPRNHALDADSRCLIPAAFEVRFLALIAEVVVMGEAVRLAR